MNKQSAIQFIGTRIPDIPDRPRENRNWTAAGILALIFAIGFVESVKKTH